MINSWSLLYDELYGEDEMSDNTITSLESDEYDPKPQSDSDDADWNDPIITVGSGNTASAYASVFNINLDTITDVSIDTSGIEGINLDVDPDYIAPEFVNFTMEGVDLVDDSPSSFSTLSDNDDSIAHHITSPIPEKPQANLDYKPQKYEEDKGIADLKNYVTSTYRGHYTSEQNNTQTLDLIQSVGDAESFCRSNAIKYLARYDKKGSAKNDILKAMHYCLLLYYFSGNTQEPDYTNTRYETF
jgi:hypothetical protein